MQESQPDPNAPARPQLGLGACLAGQSVRYDGESNSANAHLRNMCWIPRRCFVLTALSLAAPVVAITG